MKSLVPSTAVAVGCHRYAMILAMPNDAIKGPITGEHAYVEPGALVSQGCVIGHGASVGAGAVIGDQCSIDAGVRISGAVTIAQDVTIGANAVLTAETYERTGAIHIAERVSIGANATVSGSLEVGTGATIQAGAVVTSTVPAHAIVAGNPARIVGYAGAALNREPQPAATDPGVFPTPVRGVTVHVAPLITDLRGSLTAGHLGDAIPFLPRRWFMVFDVPGEEVRGAHAHRECHQYLMCVRGTVNVMVDDGEHRAEYVLSDLCTGIYLPPMTWGVQYRYSSESVLLAFASHPYDPADYIREYDEFQDELRRGGTRN